ncbi:uncharacterized protein MKZ38_008451 [Zalerion maritima]|uniref:C2H2-type domain-containing protein n=1 Tax=Zalerion maritima TaxID=339359 RepID=A0AAD5RGN2_9PEZI|nr:uncharacterized protein MKZ38_008451 [Zalerion maritima]
MHPISQSGRPDLKAVNDDTTSSTPISAGDNGINQSSYTPEVKLPSSPPHLLGLADFVEFGGSDNALAFPEREVSELLGFSDRYIPPPDANFLQIDMPLDPFSHSIFPYSSVARLETRHNPTNYNRSLHVSSYERERTSMNNINTLEDSSVYSTARQMLGSNCVGIDGQEPILELPWKDSVSPPTPSASSSPSLTQYQAHSQSRDQHQASASASASASTHSHLPPTPAIVTTPPSPTPSPSSQDAHELTTSTTSGFTCHYKGCNEAFTLDKDRERHERETHRQIKPFACSWCDDMFSRKGNRNRHMETCPTNPAVGGRRTWRPSSVALREKKDEVKEGVPEGYEENKKKRVVNEDEEEPGSDTGTSAMSVETSVKPRERKRRYDSGDENGMDDDDDDDDVDSLKRRLDFVESEVKIERAKRKAVETRLRKVVRSKLKSKRRRQG